MHRWSLAAYSAEFELLAMRGVTEGDAEGRITPHPRQNKCKSVVRTYSSC